MVKIEFAHIVPYSMLKLAEKYSDMHLLLYHWAQQNEGYVNFMSKSRRYKILDNSQYELRQEIDYKDLIRYAKKMNVNEIVAPDIMHQFRKTKKLIDNFIPLVPKYINDKKVKIQGVVCGRHILDLHNCFDWMHEHEHIDVIAISKHGCTSTNNDDHFAARQRFFSSSYGTWKPIHFLGVNHFKDLDIWHVNEIKNLIK